MRPAPLHGWVVLAAASILGASGRASIVGRVGTGFVADRLGAKPTLLGMGLGSFAGGAIHDALGSYQGLFAGSFAIGAMAVVLAVSLRPPGLARRPVPS